MNFDLTTPDFMSGINFNVIVFFSVYFISIIGTKLVIVTLRNKITDPDIALITGKKKAPVPTNGGFAMVLAMIMGFLVADVDYMVVAPVFALMGIPLLAGIIPIPAFIKFVLRVAAVILTLTIIPKPIFHELLPPLFDKSLAGFFWLWVMHSFEKLEVVEGLLPIQIITIGAGISSMFFLSDNFFAPLSIQSMIFACAGIGFLWWNKYPAKVRAGELGSVPTGFIAGYLLIMLISSGYGAAALIIPAYFLADSCMMFFDRPFSEKFVSNKQSKPVTPYCLRAIKNSYAPRWIVRTITGINMLLIFLATQIIISPYMMLFNIFLAYAMVFTLIWHFSQKNTTYHI